MLKKLLVALMMLYSGSVSSEVTLYSGIISGERNFCNITVKIMDKPNITNEYTGIPYTGWRQDKNFTKEILPQSIKLVVNLVKESQECEIFRLPKSGLFNIYIPDNVYNRAFNKSDEIKMKIFLSSLPTTSKFEEIKKITP